MKANAIAIALILCCSAAAFGIGHRMGAAHQSHDVADWVAWYRLGWNDGWNDGWVMYSVDAFAVKKFHDDADRWPTDDPGSLALIWDECKVQADRMEVEWHRLPNRGTNTFKPFWKSDN